MNASQSLIDELEEAITHHELGFRADVFRSVTDLFMSGYARYSNDQVALFDDVMSRLIHEIDENARAELGLQLADIPNAPPNIIRKLSLDDSINVAGTILSRSEQLDDKFLVESAKTKSQDHLLAISRRRSLGEAVTDVLVERGNQQVALSVATNSGAKFSEFGYSTLVERAKDDDNLALSVWSRPEVPRQHLLKLFAHASENVQREIEVTDRRKVNLIRNMIAQASDQIQSTSREGSAEFAAARSLVELLHKSGKLSETHLVYFAHEGEFNEIVVAVSLMCDVPFGVVERAIINDNPDQFFVLAKTIDLSWDTTKAVLLVQSGTPSRSTRELDRRRESFTKLRPGTAKKAIQFYRLREQSAKYPAG
jgi:uncharacterized protein (DUF2336 family)